MQILLHLFIQLVLLVSGVAVGASIVEMRHKSRAEQKSSIFNARDFVGLGDIRIRTKIQKTYAECGETFVQLSLHEQKLDIQIPREQITKFVPGSYAILKIDSFE